MSVDNDVSGKDPQRRQTDSLPPRETTHWVASRKAQVVTAVQRGLLSLDEALVRYRLTIEEFVSWQRGLHHHGLQGLQVTHVRLSRPPRPRAGRAARRGAS